MYNGKVMDTDRLISVKDTAPLRGYGLFDYFKVIDSVPVFVEDHIARLQRSCKGLRLEIPYSDEQLLEMIHKMIEIHPVDTFAIRFLVTPGVGIDSATKGESEVFCIGEPITLPTVDDLAKGQKLITLDYVRFLPEYKSINYLALMAYKHLLAEHKANDFLFIHNGKISESTRSNIFFIDHDGGLHTTHEYVLEGVTRKQLLSLLEDDFKINIRTIDAKEINNFKEAFLTGSSKNVMPISQIDDCIYDKNNHFTHKIIKLFDQHSKQYIGRKRSLEIGV
jgi:D-alanine transaminase/branched-chain amino acid aminotransferase